MVINNFNYHLAFFTCKLNENMKKLKINNFNYNFIIVMLKLLVGFFSVTNAINSYVYSNTSTVQSTNINTFVCNGIDDNIMIQSAIKYTNKNGGGNVYLSSGTFYLSKILFYVQI